MSSSEQLNLLNLPPDIIRKVIQVGLEDVDIIKTISPRWNYIVGEHLNNKKRLPVISTFLWRVDIVDIVDWHFENFTFKVTKLRVHIDERFRQLFGLELSERQEISGEPVFELTHDSSNLDSRLLKKLSKRLTRLFGRSSGIRRLVLVEDYEMNTDEGHAIINEMKGMEINTVFYKGQAIIFELLISQVLRANKVGRLVLQTTPSKSQYDNFLDLIVKFARIVPAIELTSHDPDGEQDQPVNNLQQLQNVQQQAIRAEHDAARLEWRNFVNYFCQSEKVTASLQEEYLPNGRLRFYITITAKS